MKYRRQNNAEHPGGRLRARRRRAVAVLPTLFTLGNAICGFAAIHYAAKGGAPIPFGADRELSNFAIAGYLIFFAMLFDMLDGRMARLARATSDFGGELDSLADMISFGAAPAFLTLQHVAGLLGGMRGLEFLGPNADSVLGRLFWIIGAIYVSCTALRLARFNVHNRHGEEAHMQFRGLPSPGAAGVVASSVIFFEALQPKTAHIFAALHTTIPGPVYDAIIITYPYAMPIVLLAAALLMVSRFSYAHVVNQYLRGRRSFGYVVRVAVLVIIALWQPQITALLLIYLYALSAPATWAYRAVFRRDEPRLVVKAEERAAAENGTDGPANP